VEDAGHVDADVDRAEVLLHGGHHTVHLGRVGDVEPVAGGPGQVGRCRAYPRLVDVGEGDPRAEGAERSGYGGPDAARGTGDQGDPAGDAGGRVHRHEGSG
jgi:hypothetical protein